MHKECSRCNQSKLLIDFYPKSRKSEYPNTIAGVDHVCKECAKKDRSAYIAKNKSKCKQSDRKYHLSKYGLTIDDYNQMFTSQEGKCLGCDKHQSEFTRNLVVDHCHKTSKVRGLLCWQCNSALGCIKDNAQTLSNLIKYLKNTELAEETNVVALVPLKKEG